MVYVTWVEMLLLVSMVAVGAALPRRRTTAGRLVILCGVATFLALLLLYGQEFLEDFL
jgi:hypothetical protein